MRIVHVLHQTAHGPMSYRELTSGGRGITGSEQAYLYLAKHQAALGHQVTCYLPTNHIGFQEGVELIDVMTHWPRLRRMDNADVVISWLSGDPLRVANPKSLRVLSYQINDHMLSCFNYGNYADVFVSVSKAHQDHLLLEPGHPEDLERWETLPNGVDLTRFTGSKKRVDKRCVYMSSPDRGLHWLLAMWPEIRFAHPTAELHVYYEVQKWLDTTYLQNSEVGIRANYVMNRMNHLKDHGVILHGAVPPSDLATHIMEADLLLYPADTVRFTEGFGVAVLEGHAAGLVPIITDTDSLGEIYSKSGATIIHKPEEGGSEWTDQFLEATLKMLDDPSREQIRPQVQAFAEQYSWDKVALQWDDMIQRRLAQKGG
mgnify:FL=1